jgi:hypothetical protein
VPNTSRPTRPDIRPIRNVGCYAIVPPPRHARNEVDVNEVSTVKVITDIVPPDDRSLDEWLLDWEAQAERLKHSLFLKVEDIIRNGRQGNLGLAVNAHERTPADALVLVAKRLVTFVGTMRALQPVLAMTLSSLRKKEAHDVLREEG